jgi:hypothetical protein
MRFSQRLPGWWSCQLLRGDFKEDQMAEAEIRTHGKLSSLDGTAKIGLHVQKWMMA